MKVRTIVQIHRAAGILATPVVLLMIECCPSTCASSSARLALHGELSYGGEYSSLAADGNKSYGWDLKNGKMTTAASKAALELSWGPKFYQFLALQLYSTRSILPTEIGEGPNHDADLDRIAAIWGVSSGFVPKLRFAKTAFVGTGVADGTLPLLRDNRQLAVGEDFDTGITYDRVMLVWDFGTAQRKLSIRKPGHFGAVRA